MQQASKETAQFGNRKARADERGGGKLRVKAVMAERRAELGRSLRSLCCCIHPVWCGVLISCIVLRS